MMEQNLSDFHRSSFALISEHKYKKLLKLKTVTLNVVHYKMGTLNAEYLLAK